MRVAIFAGSFDPYTIGHHDIVQRGLALFDKIVIAIGKNSSKKQGTDIEERIAAIRAIYAQEPHVEVCAYDCLTTDLAQEKGAAFLLRGVRNVQDYEYERQLAEANKALTGIETVLLYTRPELAYVSSSLVRELISYGKNVEGLLPKL